MNEFSAIEMLNINNVSEDINTVFLVSKVHSSIVLFKTNLIVLIDILLYLAEINQDKLFCAHYLKEMR